jgi:hypothetical protein
MELTIIFNKILNLQELEVFYELLQILNDLVPPKFFLSICASLQKSIHKIYFSSWLPATKIMLS